MWWGKAPPLSFHCKKLKNISMKKKTTSDLREALKTGVIEFTFTKLNGETRKAKGTTNANFIPEEYQSKGSSRKASGVVTYFDVEVNGYRNVSEGTEVKF